MKNLIISIALAIVMFSCDNRKFELKDYNKAPTLSFVQNGIKVTEIKDSIKLSLKNSQVSYPVEINYQDFDKNILDLGYKYVLGSGVIRSEGAELKNLPYSNEVLFGQFKLNVYPQFLGETQVYFTITDKYNMLAQTKLTLIGFENIGPKSSFIVTPVKIADDYHYELDASASYDGDARFGGTVARYQWRIGDKEIKTDLSKVNYIFPRSGKYEISLSVLDNDGFTSNEVKKVVDIN